MPVPEVPRPVAVFELVHEIVAVEGLTAKVEAGMLVPWHCVSDETGEITGLGLTVIVKLCGDPTQVPMLGVTVKFPVAEAVPELVAVNEMFPLPLAAAPMEVFELVQLFVAPAVPDNVTEAALPAQ